MSHISKWLNLFALFILAGSAMTACAPMPDDGDGHPLRATLSLLETKAARMEATATPKTPPTGEQLPVPFTGTGGTQVVVTESPQPIQEPSLTPALLELDGSPTSDSLSPQPSPTFDCPTHEARVTLSAPRTTLKVGEAVEVKVLLENTGCVMLGLPQYRLAILNSEGKPIFSPDKPEPVIHSKGINPGQYDEVSYLLQAVSPGKATLSALASFEVHLGYPGPAYWGAGSSKELIIQVEP